MTKVERILTLLGELTSEETIEVITEAAGNVSEYQVREALHEACVIGSLDKEELQAQMEDL